MADAEMELMTALTNEITKPGVGPKTALENAKAFKAMAGPIVAVMAADPKGGQESVMRAVDYVLARAKAMWDAEEAKKPAPQPDAVVVEDVVKPPPAKPGPK